MYFKNYENVHLNVSYDFSNFNRRKSKCDVHSDITQGWACLFIFLSKKSTRNILNDITQEWDCPFVFL